MIINELHLTQYRNLSKLDLTFHKKMNVFYGENGQGKTNIVEAIAYLSTLRSFRLHKDEDVLQQNALFFAVEAEMEIAQRKSLLRVVYSVKDKKMFLNGNEMSKAREFIGVSNVIVFTAGDITLFQDSPKRRRYFIDSELSKISPSYLFSLMRYQKYLKERNELLKSNNVNILYLDVLTKEMVKEVKTIEAKRMEFLKLLEASMAKMYNDFSKENHQIRFEYESVFHEQETFEQIYARYEAVKQKDIERRFSQIGPHKDDLIFLLDGQKLEIYGSQGQQRLAAISLKLALLEVVTHKIGENPIVIFDDVMSDLDEKKRQQLLTSLSSEMQVFITTANVSEIREFIPKQQTNFYLVEQGTVREEIGGL